MRRSLKRIYRRSTIRHLLYVSLLNRIAFINFILGFWISGIPINIALRQIKYLNNIVEQDHRFIKMITKLRKRLHVDSENLDIFEQFYGLVA